MIRSGTSPAISRSESSTVARKSRSCRRRRRPPSPPRRCRARSARSAAEPAAGCAAASARAPSRAGGAACPPRRDRSTWRCGSPPDGLDRRHPQPTPHGIAVAANGSRKPMIAPRTKTSGSNGVRITGSGSRSSAPRGRPPPSPARTAARSDAGERDLGAEQQRPDRKLAGRHSERHPVDLPPLGLDDAGRQVEGGEGGGEDQQGEDVEELLVALRVLVEDAVRRLVVERRHVGAEGAAGDGVLELGPDRGRIGPLAQRDDDVVDGGRTSGQVLGGGQRGEEDGEARLAPPKSPPPGRVRRKYSGDVPRPT